MPFSRLFIYDRVHFPLYLLQSYSELNQPAILPPASQPVSLAALVGPSWVAFSLSSITS